LKKRTALGESGSRRGGITIFHKAGKSKLHAQGRAAGTGVPSKKVGTVLKNQTNAGGGKGDCPSRKKTAKKVRPRF